MSNRLYIAWQDEATRRWHTVGRLTRLPDGYELVFTHGSRHMGSLPKSLFGMNTAHRYRFQSLLPIFRNRIPPKGRSDYRQIANWVGLTGDEDEFTLLSRFGLIPGSDLMMVYPEPHTADDEYVLDFFVHGIRHMHPSAVAWCNYATEGETVLPLLDVKNGVDPEAIALRGEKDTILIGYVPAFYAADLRAFLGTPSQAAEANITLLRNNRDAPIQHRLMCRFTAPVTANFHWLRSEEHEPNDGQPSRVVVFTT